MARADGTSGSPSPGDLTSGPATGNAPAAVPATAEGPATAGGPVVRASRAGRNLPAAIAVGVLLGALVIGVLVLAPTGWVAVVAGAVAIATWEVTKRLREADVLVPRVPVLLGGQAIVWSAWPWGTTGVLGAFGASIVVVMLWRLFDHGLASQPRNYLRDTAVAVFTLAWVPLLASFAALMVLQEGGSARVLVLMLACVSSDIGGYAAGVLFGKHPMAPAISPKKSWEGFAGSLVAATVASALTVHFLLDRPWWIGLVLGVILVVSATAGDLVESQVKRDLGIKDMGTLLPGHGGIMDRIDSILPSALVTWLVLTAFG